MKKQTPSLAQYVQEKYSPTATASYLARIEKYKVFNPNHKQGTLQEVLQYLKALRAKGAHPKTVRNYLHSIKIYYDYLLATRQNKTHPCKALQLKDKIDKSIRTEALYSPQQLQRYLAQTPENKKAMASLLVYQGLRTSELCGLKIHHIHLEAAELQVNGRTLPLAATQILLMAKHIAQLPCGQAYLFINRYGQPYRSSEINGYINYGRAEKDHITPLKIRQSFIKNLLQHNDLLMNNL